MGSKKKNDDMTLEQDDALPTDDNVSGAGDAPAEPVDVQAEPTLEDRLDELQAEASRYKDHYLRALADLENYRKRAQREKEEAIRFANVNLLREMIPVVDNLERAIEHAGENGGQDEGLMQGVQMTLEQFRKVLTAFGVKPVHAAGSPFDPNYHQAMGQIVSSDHAPNTVVEELQKGYTLNDRLLRPAMVMVARAPDPESPAQSDPDNGPGDA